MQCEGKLEDIKKRLCIGDEGNEISRIVEKNLKYVKFKEKENEIQIEQEVNDYGKLKMRERGKLVEEAGRSPYY